MVEKTMPCCKVSVTPVGLDRSPAGLMGDPRGLMNGTLSSMLLLALSAITQVGISNDMRLHTQGAAGLPPSQPCQPGTRT